MIANPRFDAGRFRPPADDAVGVLLEKGIGGQLAGLAAGAPEEIAVDVIGDAGCFDIIVQALIETMPYGYQSFTPRNSLSAPSASSRTMSAMVAD
jgi:hypothetical protein